MVKAVEGPRRAGDGAAGVREGPSMSEEWTASQKVVAAYLKGHFPEHTVTSVTRA
jgi:hypothetical protein